MPWFSAYLLFRLVSQVNRSIAYNRFGIGNLLCSVGLKTLNDHEPLVYLKAVYTEWAMLGMMAIIYVCLPESPYWLADKGKHEAGVRSLRRINGKIEGYDVDFHYGLVRRTVELEKQRSEALNGERRGLMAELISLKEVFSGINGVSQNPWSGS